MECPTEACNKVAVLLQIGLGGEVGRVGNLAALLADGAEEIALPCLDDLRSRRLKQGYIVSLPAGESPCHHVELHRGIHHRIHMGHHAVLFHHILQCHLRHAALAPADNGLAPQVFP